MTEKTEKIISDFDKNYNISYIDEENTPEVTNKQIWKHYFCTLLIFGVIILIYNYNPSYVSYIKKEIRLFYNLLYLSYAIFSPIIYFIFRPKSLYKSHSIEIINYIKRIFLHKPSFNILTPEAIKTELEYYKPTYLESQSLMLIFIKAFFGVIMINSCYMNIENLVKRFPTFVEIYQITIDWFCLMNENLFEVIGNKNCQFLYKNTLIILFTIDLFIFSVGYLTELSILKNKIRTVETTVGGIFFCLICYHPFNNAAGYFFNWFHPDNAVAFGDETSLLTWAFRFAGLIFISIYVAASVALGTKGSNLTNRGIVSCFPYNIVRHPAYICKSLFWIITTIPVFLVDFSAESFKLSNYLNNLAVTIVGATAWISIYYFRALTEERHLIKDPDYQKYVKKVKYRFIPGII